MAAIRETGSAIRFWLSSGAVTASLRKPSRQQMDRMVRAGQETSRSRSPSRPRPPPCRGHTSQTHATTSRCLEDGTRWRKGGEEGHKGPPLKQDRWHPSFHSPEDKCHWNLQCPRPSPHLQLTMPPSPSLSSAFLPVLSPFLLPPFSSPHPSLPTLTRCRRSFPPHADEH